jgi:tRNA threonylcarbamoyladenosine modification (KEOPS) complex  Pcc1 subunit
MSFQATFIIPDADSSFEKLFAPELADVNSAYKNNRATITFKKIKTNTIITVLAQDAVALRAMTNGITKILAIQNKMDGVK